MKCPKAGKWLLLRDSGELPARRAGTLDAHVRACPACQGVQDALAAVKTGLVEPEAPGARLVQAVLREARLLAPEPAPARRFLRAPALAAAAVLLAGLGLFFRFRAHTPDRVALELVVNEAQLLDLEGQIASILYRGLTEDDLAFHFAMTFEGEAES